MRWLTSVSLICFLFVGLCAFTSCYIGMSKEEKRQHYLDLAIEYGEKTREAQEESADNWNKYLRWAQGISDYTKETAEDYKRQSEHYAKLAEEYSRKAERYIALAEKYK